MGRTVTWAGIDVHEVRYHGSALDKQSGEELNCQCRATLKGLVQTSSMVVPA